MVCFLFSIAMFAVGYGAGTWINAHPQDARAQWDKLRAALGRLFNR